MSIVEGIIIPVIKIVVYLGFFGTLFYFGGKAIWNGWSKRYMFVLKHKVMKKPYPESIVKWVMENMNDGISYTETKKFLMIKNRPQKEINEILWIYEQLCKEMKGGKDKNGRKFKGIGREITTEQELPKYSSKDIPTDKF